MPALVPTEYYATIQWLGVVPDREASLRATPRARLPLAFEGVVEDAHTGITRPSCSRVTSQHPKGTEIANARQLCVMSAEEIAAIAAQIGVETLDPSYMGATVVLEGIPDFTHIPPSARLQGPDGATLVVDMENQPCQLPAREIEADLPGHGKGFKAAAVGRRGVTCWVERPGVLELGARLRLHIPQQRAWAPGFDL